MSLLYVEYDPANDGIDYPNNAHDRTHCAHFAACVLLGASRNAIAVGASAGAMPIV
jgi:hypothetical protein